MDAVRLLCLLCDREGGQHGKGSHAAVPCTRARHRHIMQLDALLLELFQFCESAPVQDPRWLRLKSCAVAAAQPPQPHPRASSHGTLQPKPPSPLDSPRVQGASEDEPADHAASWQVHMLAEKQVCTLPKLPEASRGSLGRAALTCCTVSASGRSESRFTATPYVEGTPAKWVSQSSLGPHRYGVYIPRLHFTSELATTPM